LVARITGSAIVFTTVPIVAPVVTSLGYDPIWFGVLFVMNMQIHSLSPPFGPARFWLKSVAPEDVTLQEIFASVWPFIALQIIGLVLVMLFPQIAALAADHAARLSRVPRRIGTDRA
jgi:TRAP-type mannitol/chloroaromatic compound transport system permease large subunit